MTKKLILMITAVMLLAVGKVGAQKTAHINSQEILLAMPESKIAQDSLEKMKKDAYETLKQMDDILKKRYDEYLVKKADPATPKSTLTILEKDLQEFQNRIPATEEQLSAELQQKEGELFQPILQKIKDAVAKVSKEQGVNYVFDTQVMIYFEGGLDLQPLVEKELGIVKKP